MTRTMRAFQVPGPGEPFTLVQREIPEPEPGQVRVRVHACGICRSDVFAVNGIPGATYPLVPGHEIAGVVDAAGPGVESWRPGDRAGIGWFGGQCGECDSCRRGAFVTCARLKAPGLQVDGGYADYVVVPVAALARVPDGIDLVRAAPLMCAGVTAFNALRRGAPTAGSRVAVIGIGGVGHLAVQFARCTGCETIAVSRGLDKRELALKLGAHHFVDALDPGAADAVKALGGADVIIVTAPDGGAVQRFLAAAAPGGRIVVTGFSRDPIQARSVDLIARGLTITGSAAGTSMDAEETLRFSLINGISPVMEEFPLEAADDAYASMLAGTAAFRAVLRLDETSGVPRQSAPPFGASQVSVDEADENIRGGGAQQAPALITGQPDPILDCPFEELPDINQLISAAVRWHFSQETGSPFWLKRAEKLGFDPVRDVHTLEDLRLFPNFVNDLRYERIEDLIPRGYGDDPPLLAVFESGGVTGPPKRVVLLSDWLERWLAWGQRSVRERRFDKAGRFLVIAPTGPHLMTYMSREAVRRRNGIIFNIDLDPRWVRKCINEGRQDEADRYADHLISQAASILETQDVNILTITPPLLEKLARQPKLVDLVRQKISLISWGGTHMDADTRHLYRTQVFPGIRLHGGYGSTMVLGGSVERAGTADQDQCVFDPFSPYITFSVIDPSTGQPVPYGQRGQVVMNHVSKAMFLPNNLERDTAIRIKALPGHAGDAVADVYPVQTFDDAEVTEGVY